MQHVHVDLPLEINLICANTLHFLKSCFDMFDFENRDTWKAACSNLNLHVVMVTVVNS